MGKDAYGLFFFRGMLSEVSGFVEIGGDLIEYGIGERIADLVAAVGENGAGRERLVAKESKLADLRIGG